MSSGSSPVCKIGDLLDFVALAGVIGAAVRKRERMVLADSKDAKCMLPTLT